MSGRAITKLLEAAGWGHDDLVAAMRRPDFGIAPAPTAAKIREWEQRDELPVPVAMCLRHIAASEKLVWERGAWKSAFTERITGAQVREIRERINWSQSRLARELGTKQPQIAQWEARPTKRLSGLATYALRAAEARHATPSD